MNSIQVHLDNADTGALSYRPVQSGARWRCGFTGKKNLSPLAQVVADADKATGWDAYAIDYVTRKA